MITRDPGAPFGTPNAVIGRQGRNELTLSFRPDPNLSRLLVYVACECCELGEMHFLRDIRGGAHPVDRCLSPPDHAL